MEKVEFPPSDKPAISFSSSSKGGADCDDDLLDDSCSICLDGFTSHDPAAITTCKHEYHLHCILEWSQRSSECPICWQALSLKDRDSQELLTAIEKDRKRRSKKPSIHTSTTVGGFHEDFVIGNDLSSSEFQDFDEHVLHQLVAAANRARYLRRRDRPRSSVHYQTSPEPEESLFIQHSDNDTESINSPTSPDILPQISVSPPVFNNTSSTSRERGLFRRSMNSQESSNGPQGMPSASPPPDASSLSESLKSRFSSATNRYKESFSRSTKGIKDKILARNSSVKELSKGVQREMSAGIAGFSRMIERLDLTSRRSAASVSVATHEVAPSNLSVKGKGVLDGAGMVGDGNTNEELCDLGTIPGRLEIIPTKEGR
ncbi:hypothetical protein MLD38_036167 [Melastoma candidum]|uniref:Uncharacterized protein n=1 Tax=Melastoma candidum TaxID=119954 RepID=A0ACB9LIU6_9MYRT|nr:hypothetical protein MLD38_036167 [Melastoma candidum]